MLSNKFFTVALTVVSFSILLSSCIVVEDREPVYYGPSGMDGRVFFGIDYDQVMPYSYWDNNPNVPNNPYFGDYYQTEAGVYDFEYFVNPYEYWYGTYETYQVYGEPGGLGGVAGADGADTYLLLICNPDGFYFEGWEECTCYRNIQADGTMVIDGSDREHRFHIEMKKANISERPSKHLPKLRSNER